MIRIRQGLSSLEICFLIEEFQELVGGKINKIYQLDDEIRIRIFITTQGQRELVIIPGKSIHLTEYDRPKPQNPPAFAMQLRKYLSNKTILSITQPGFERIVEFELDDYYLIIELFSKGNVILTDKDKIIIGVMERQIWRDRKLIQGERYRYPPAFSLNPQELTLDSVLSEIKKNQEMDVVRFVAKILGFGGTYAEEFCLRTNLNKTSPVKNIEAELFIDNIRVFLDNLRKEKKPNITKDDIIDFFPCELMIYRDKEKEYFDSFNKAIDIYYKIYEDTAADSFFEKKKEHERKHLEHILELQKAKLAQYISMEKESTGKANAIMMNISEVKEIIDTISAARKKYSWDVIKKRIEAGKRKKLPEAEKILEINEKEGYIILDL